MALMLLFPECDMAGQRILRYSLFLFLFSITGLVLENTDGRKFVSMIQQGPYTSMGWKYAEGKIGSPIRFTLRFRKPDN